MDILQILIGVLIGVGATTYKNKRTNNKKEKKMDVILRQSEDLMEIIKKLTYTDEINKVRIIEKNKSQKKYGYKRSGYLFTIQIEKHKIKCDVIKSDDENKETILEFEYDQYWGEFTNKKVLRSVIEGYQEKEASKTLEHFMDKISKKINWDSIDEILEVVDDVNMVKEYYSEKEGQTLKEIDDSIAKIEKEIINKEIAKEFVESLKALKEVNEKIKFKKTTLPIVIKRKYEEVNIREINNLKKYYLEMSEESRKQKEREIKEVLEEIRADAEEVLKNLNEEIDLKFKSTIEIIKRG